MRWCSMPGRTPTTCFISTTVWGHSCWISTTGSLVFCRVSGTKAKTFPWRWAQTSFHTSWRWNWRYSSIILCQVFSVSFTAFIFLHFHTHNFSVFPDICHNSLCHPTPLQKYMKPIYTEESYLEVQRKQKRSFNTQQLTAFRLLFAWRDKLARQEDESTG